MQAIIDREPGLWFLILYPLAEVLRCKWSSFWTRALSLTDCLAFHPQTIFASSSADGGCPKSHLTLSTSHHISAINMSFSEEETQGGIAPLSI